MDLVLASTSRYRRELLNRLGLPFQAVAPAVDEDTLKRADDDPRRQAERLADAKATSLAAQFPRAAIIGSDQVAVCEGRILGKPGSPSGAVAQLLTLVGRRHELITAVTVWHPGGIERHTDITGLVMRALDQAAIERYVAADDPCDCAGSYKFESRGIALFEQVDTRDPSAITGLPLLALTTILRRLGFDIPGRDP